jgi:hypothetical protein
MKLTDKIWNENKKYLHTLVKYLGKEIHHTFPGKVGIEKCCMLLVVPGEPGHQNDWMFVEQQRDSHRDIRREVQQNYRKDFGCYKAIRKECTACAMPKLSEVTDEKKENESKEVEGNKTLQSTGQTAD